MKTKQQYKRNMKNLLGDIRKWELEQHEAQERRRKAQEIELSWELKEDYDRDCLTEGIMEVKHAWIAGASLDV